MNAPFSDACAVDFDFRQHLYDTIVLLGGREDIAALLHKSSDCALTEADINELRTYNVGLLNSIKGRLRSITTIAARTKAAKASDK